MRACRDREQWEWASNLAIAIDGYLEIAGYWIEHVTANEIGLLAAQAFQNSKYESNFLGNLGGAYRNLGQMEKATEHIQQALTISREIGDRRGESSHLGNLGIAYAELGQVEKARQLWEQSLRICEEINSPNAETLRRWLAALDGQ